MRRKKLPMHALLQWLVGLAMLCNTSLLSAQTFADGDTLKYTVLAERVNDNTVVVRLAALNETSLFWANQQGILLKRYTIARDGAGSLGAYGTRATTPYAF